MWQNGTNSNGSTISLNNIVPNQVINIDATFNATQNQNPGNDPQQNTNTEAAMTVSAGAGSYQIRGNNVNYDDEVEISINGFRWDHSNTIQYNAENSDTTVTFTFETLWINRFYDNIVINGTSYTVSDYLDFDDRTEWLIANHGTQALAFDIPNVAKADSYNVVVKHGENNGSKYLATFLWTADPAQANGHNYIGNAKLEFVKATYSVGNTTYTVTEKDLEGKLQRDGGFLSADSEDGFLNYGVTADVNYDDGSLTLPGGAEVTMRVVPDYGYQVTSVNGGDDFKTTNSGVSEFTVTVEEGTAGYFQATVEKVDNTVTPTSEKVKAGNIVLGDNAATDIKNGTVRLSVEDVELTSDKITNFEEKASEAGDYTITNYLDINLDKVLYKGTADDVWSEQIHHLTDKALITLQLEEGVDASNIVIVHNIDNGDEFEIIPIESYDAETNTISFYTNSFSNYAIANKISSTTENTKTTDTSSTDSAKGIKAGTLLTIDGGKYDINSIDDGIHSNGNITINNGEFTIISKDDGIHGDGMIEINNGTFSITAAEGIEATYVKINDGTITISASDDGINAGNKSSAYSVKVEINGGNITINMGTGDTDGIDSNGDIIINGGTINVTAQSTFDYDGTGTINGGTVICNGQKVTTLPNQMMGGQMSGQNSGPMNGNMGNSDRGMIGGRR